MTEQITGLGSKFLPGSAVGIVQARTDSKRFPGKILSPLFRGLSVLDVLWARIRQTGIPWWLATTERSVDDQLSGRAASLGFQVFRGSTDDVLSRYESIARLSGARLIVKVNGDNPTTGTEAIAAMLREASSKNMKSSMLADTANTRHHPLGHLPQVLSKDVLKTIRHLIPEGDNFHLTHVTSILLGSRTRQTSTMLGPKAFDLRWTVDSSLDMQAMGALFRNLDVPFESASYRDFLRAVKASPKEATSNRHERQKAIEHG